MRAATALAALLLLSVALAGCAYKPLKAPCSADEAGTPLAYSGMAQPAQPDAFRRLDPCGPMRPI